jgi:hypothetical protein
MSKAGSSQATSLLPHTAHGPLLAARELREAAKETVGKITQKRVADSIP